MNQPAEVHHTVNKNDRPTVEDIFDALAGWEIIEETLLEWKERSSNQREHLSEDFLLRAVGHPEPEFRALAAQAGHWSIEIMSRAIVDDDPGVRTVAACSSATPSAALDEAADDDDLDVRRGVAANPATPAPTLHRMATTPGIGLWSYLLQNPKTSTDTLELVPTGRRPSLHRQLITHPNASDAVRRRVACHYLDEPEAPLRIMGLQLMFRSTRNVAKWGEGRADHPAPPFERPSEVLQWLAEGADVSTVVDFAHSASCPDWLRAFIMSRVPGSELNSA